MSNDSTPDGVSIEIRPFDLATVTSALTVCETMLATAETSILELGKRLFVDGAASSELNQADYIGATVDMIRDAKSRIVKVRDGLRKIDALPADESPIGTAPAPTEFLLHYHAWQTAVGAFEAHCAAHEPADDASDLMTAYECSYAPLVDAMYGAAFAAIYTAAANAGEIELKRKVFELQQLDTLSPREMKPLLDAIKEDASRFDGDAK